MPIARRQLLTATAGLIGLAACPVRAAADWPVRPVTLVVPWPAGGPSDFVARQIQADVAKALGQPLVLLARKDLLASTVDELIALAQQQRGGKPLDKPLSMANTGPGSMFHLVGEKLAQQAGIELLPVPYKGSAPALGDLMGGQVDLMFTIFAGPVPAMVADGKLKAIGLATAQPLPGFPQIAALAAHPKLKGFEFDSWAGIQVPRATPDAVAERLNKVLYAAMQNPATRQAFEKVGNRVLPPQPLAELERTYQAEIGRYQAIARAINLQPQQ